MRVFGSAAVLSGAVCCLFGSCGGIHQLQASTIIIPFLVVVTIFNQFVPISENEHVAHLCNRRYI